MDVGVIVGVTVAEQGCFTLFQLDRGAGAGECAALRAVAGRARGWGLKVEAALKLRASRAKVRT